MFFVVESGYSPTNPLSMPGRGVGAQDGRPCYRPMQLPRYPQKKNWNRLTTGWSDSDSKVQESIDLNKTKIDICKKLLPLRVLAVREVSQPAMNSLKGEAVLLKLGNSMLLLHQSKHQMKWIFQPHTHIKWCQVAHMTRLIAVCKTNCH